MRVISGSARGHPLKVPKGMSTRPMNDKVKSAVFSMLTNILAQLEREWGRVLDLYSGTGSIGIEALSRGAEWADFVEINAGVCRLISENLEHTHLSDKARVNNRAVQNFISKPPPPPKSKGGRAAGGLHRRKGGSVEQRRASRDMSPVFIEEGHSSPPIAESLTQSKWDYDIIFLDPPYADPKIQDMLKHLATSGLVKPEGLVVIGHSPRVVLVDSYGEVDEERQAVMLNRLRYRRHGDSAFSVYLAGDPDAYGFGEAAEATLDDNEAAFDLVELAEEDS